MKLIVVDWEGGERRAVSLREWWHFIRTPANQVVLPAPPSWAGAQYQAKCFAGIETKRWYAGYDFIIPRLRKQARWKGKIRPLAEWRCSRLGEAVS